MNTVIHHPVAGRMPSVLWSLAICVMMLRTGAAQGLTGTLIGTVKDAQGGRSCGASVRVSSPALIGGAIASTTNDKGQLRFPVLPPGSYVLDVTFEGFASYHEDDVRLGAGATIERTVVLELAGRAESVVVEGAGSRMEARDPGFGARFGSDDLKTIPTRRSSMFDLLRAAPGISPTSPSSGTLTSVSAFGSGTNENTFLIDGTNFTSASNGIARADPGIDFIQEIHVQAVGASAEYGNVQGAVVNVVTRQGSNRLLYDASYSAQTASLTGQPVRLAIPGSDQPPSAYGRARYRDLTTSLGGPVVRDRLWFFTGMNFCGTTTVSREPTQGFPRTSQQDKIFTKLTWQLAPNWELVQSLHNEFWVNPELPTSVKPFETTLRLTDPYLPSPLATPTHTSADNTVWEVRAGRSLLSAGGPERDSARTPSRLDRPTDVVSGAPPQIGEVRNVRWTAKATVSHYRPACSAPITSGR